jgi:hypothetical protein
LIETELEIKRFRIVLDRSVQNSESIYPVVRPVEAERDRESDPALIDKSANLKPVFFSDTQNTNYGNRSNR